MIDYQQISGTLNNLGESFTKLYNLTTNLNLYINKEKDKKVRFFSEINLSIYL